jgi:ribulose-phosphate 3-epimerase
MSVFPGKGGQTFMKETLRKMEHIVSMRGNREIIIAVDGGVNMKTISTVFATNIDVAIIGSGLFKAQDVIQRYQELMHA